jgi:carbamoyl-phosphate synthase large subunit
LRIRFAVQGKAAFAISARVGPSRSTPFVARATGLPLLEVGAACARGQSLQSLGCTREPELKHSAVREAVLPAGTSLGPQPRATGEVMAVADEVATAFAKSQLAAGIDWPRSGKVRIDVVADDEPHLVDLGKRLIALGFEVHAAASAHRYLGRKGVNTVLLDENSDGPFAIEIVSTPGKRPLAPARFTTPQAARMAVGALEAMAGGSLELRPLQSYLEGADAIASAQPH